MNIKIFCFDRVFDNMESACEYEEQILRGEPWAKELEEYYQHEIENLSKKHLFKHHVDFEREYNFLVEKYNLHFVILWTDCDETPVIVLEVKDTNKLSKG